MFINTDGINPLANNFKASGSNIAPTQDSLPQAVQDTSENEGKNLALSNLLLNNEKELSSAEQAKKGIIEQALHRMFGNNNNNAMPLYPNVQFEMQNYTQEQSAQYNQESLQQTKDGFIYESADEFYQKTTIDFSAKAMINTPNGQYEIEINFQYTQEIYERHSTAIAMQQEELANNPLEVNLDNDDYSLNDLKHINLVFDAKKAEELEEEQKKNEILLKFLQSLFMNNEKTVNDEENKTLQNEFFAEVAVYERQDESYALAAQTQNGVGMYFSHEKSESAFAHASYDSNGNFSFSAGYSSYESTEFELKV